MHEVLNELVKRNEGKFTYPAQSIETLCETMTPGKCSKLISLICSSHLEKRVSIILRCVSRHAIEYSFYIVLVPYNLPVPIPLGHAIHML